MTAWQWLYIDGGFRCCHRKTKPVNWSLDKKIFVYHSVHSNSFFFPTILPAEVLERYYSFDVSI